MSYEHLYYTCDCHSPDHTLRMSYWDDYPFDLVTVEQYVSVDCSFFRRLKTAVAYIFKRTTIPFCDTMMNYDEFTKFASAVALVKARMDEKRKGSL